MQTHKFVLCRPVGGFNDSLNQIEICWRYCVVSGRRMVLDSQFSGLLDQWGQYFDVVSEKQGVILLFSEDMVHLLDQMTCYPRSVQGNIGRYKTQNLPSVGCVEQRTQERLSFDKLVDYPEQLLVHHQYGGGQLSFSSLSYFSLKPSLGRVIADLRKVDPSYVSVHVRNTDYQTDYQGLIDGVFAQETELDILLCSDDRGCKEYARGKFGRRVLSVTDTPDTGGLSLHDNKTLDRVLENTNMLIDLGMLALGERFYCSKTKQGLYSGYSVLAHYLHSNKDVLGRWISI